MPDDDPLTSLLTAHRAVFDYACQVENRAWSALYNFLTANSILILAWATLYTPLEQRFAPDIFTADGIMFALALVGFLLSIG